MWVSTVSSIGRLSPQVRTSTAHATHAARACYFQSSVGTTLTAFSRIGGPKRRKYGTEVGHSTPATLSSWTPLWPPTWLGAIEATILTDGSARGMQQLALAGIQQLPTVSKFGDDTSRHLLSVHTEEPFTCGCRLEPPSFYRLQYNIIAYFIVYLSRFGR